MADFEMELALEERQKYMTIIFNVTDGNAVLGTVSQSNLLWLNDWAQTADCSGMVRSTNCGSHMHLDSPAMAALSQLLCLTG